MEVSRNKKRRETGNPCFDIRCGWYDSDFGCTCPSLDRWYQCPLEPEPDWEAIISESESRGKEYNE